MNTNETKIFESSDIYLTAALLCTGARLIGLRKMGDRGIFILEDFPEREERVRQYFTGELEGSFKQIANYWSDLKGMIMAS